MLISLAEYAAQHGKAQISARKLAQRGRFETAQKIGRNWVIDDSEPWPDGRVKSGKYKDWRKPKGEKEMEKYEVFASEGGYRVALGIYGGNPIIDQSPWFETKEEAEEKARDVFFDDNARNIEVCEPYEDEFCVRIGSEFFDAENQEAAKEMAIRAIEKRGFSREYILEKRKDLQ